jgi:hypothetical protein
MCAIHRGRSSRVRRKRRREEEAPPPEPFVPGPDDEECTTWFDRLLGRRRFKRTVRVRHNPSFVQAETAPVLPQVPTHRPGKRVLVGLIWFILLALATYVIIDFVGTHRLVVDEYEDQSGKGVDTLLPRIEKRTHP